MGTIHLCMVELEGDGQLVAKPFLSVPPPNEERIVEDAAVHAYGSVYFRIYDGRRAYHHAIIGQVCPDMLLQPVTYAPYIDG